MTWQFETLGNAMIQVLRAGEPILVTDPWLFGDAYFGSWELERPLSEIQLDHARRSKFVWFSHGHPDHFHMPSVETLPRDAIILLPDHYDDEIRRSLIELGFTTRILPQKTWVPLGDGLRVLCVANENMDAILAIDAGGTLLLNKNDSPFCGEDRFFRTMVSKFERSYLLALCAFDADMINTFDQNMRPLIDPPEDRKPGTIWATAKIAEYLGVQNYCCSSSQHVYARPDSAWANEYRITWPDMRRLWTADSIRLVAPFSLVDLPSGTIVSTDCDDVRDPATRIIPEREEDWNARLSEDEWTKVKRFALQFETLRRWQDFIGFNVGGDTRIFQLRGGSAGKPMDRQVGAVFHVPRGSLIDTVTYGYFDDLLIGNFMKTQLFNMRLYPLFTPRVAKLGGNAKVFTAKDLRRFRLHYLRLSPLAFIRYRTQLIIQYFVIPAIREHARALGLFPLLKHLKRRLVGAPRVS
jgi:hypothetical protein